MKGAQVGGTECENNWIGYAGLNGLFGSARAINETGTQVKSLVADIYNLQTQEKSYQITQAESAKAEEKRLALIKDIRDQYLELSDA